MRSLEKFAHAYVGPACFLSISKVAYDGQTLREKNNIDLDANWNSSLSLTNTLHLEMLNRYWWPFGSGTAQIVVIRSFVDSILTQHLLWVNAFSNNRSLIISCSSSSSSFSWCWAKWSSKWFIRALLYSDGMASHCSLLILLNCYESRKRSMCRQRHRLSGWRLLAILHSFLRTLNYSYFHPCNFRL